MFSLWWRWTALVEELKQFPWKQPWVQFLISLINVDFFKCKTVRENYSFYLVWFHFVLFHFERGIEKDFQWKINISTGILQFLVHQNFQTEKLIISHAVFECAVEVYAKVFWYSLNYQNIDINSLSNERQKNWPNVN